MYRFAVIALLTAWPFSRALAELEPQVLRGQRVYEGTCSPCHGVTGSGHGPAARWLNPVPRDLTRGLFKIRSTSASLPTDDDLLRIIEVGIPGTAMFGWRDQLSLAERKDVVAFVKTLSPRFAKASSPIGEDPLGDVIRCSETQRSETLRWEGEQLYRLIGCAQCHGLRGRGDGPAAPTMKDDWGRPIRPGDFVVGTPHGNDGPNLCRVLANGMRGTPMPAFAETVLLSREDLAKIADTPDFAFKNEASIERFLALSTPAEQLSILEPSQRDQLKERRLAALAEYVMSLGRARTLWDWFFDGVGRTPMP